MGKRYYTLAEAAERLAITAEELANLVRDKKLRVRQDGERKVLRSRDIDALVGGGQNSRYATDEDDTADVINLSEADQAIIQGFGGGSGLLELTRERYDTSLGDVRYHIDLEAPAGSDLATAAESMGKAWMTIREAAAALGVSARTVEGRIKAGGLESRMRPDGRREVLVATRPTEAEAASEAVPAGIRAERQVEIARATLAMAKKLAEAHEADLKRARRSALLAWLVVVVLAVAGGGALWWGTRQAGWHELEREKVANLSDRLTDTETRLKEEKGRAAKLTSELGTVRGELRTLRQDRDRLQADLTGVREQLADSKGAARVLTLELKIANAKAAELSAELTRARATTRPTTQPVESRAGS